MGSAGAFRGIEDEDPFEFKKGPHLLGLLQGGMRFRGIPFIASIGRLETVYADLGAAETVGCDGVDDVDEF